MTQTKITRTGPELLEEAVAMLALGPTQDELTADPEAAERWYAALDEWAAAAEHKIAAYRAIYRAAEARRQLLDGEAKRYAAAATREARTVERMEGMALALLHAQEELDGTSDVRLSDGTMVEIRTRRSTAVKVVDQKAVPDRWLRYAEPAVDKSGAAKAIKAGEQIPGLELEHREHEYVRWGV